MSVSFNGFNEKISTFICHGTVDKNEPVVMYGNKTVSAAESGDVFIGIAVNSDGAHTTVQLEGHVKLPYSSTAPTVGFCTLAADGNGGVCVSDTGRKCLVLNVNSTASTVEFLL